VALITEADFAIESFGPRLIPTKFGDDPLDPLLPFDYAYGGSPLPEPDLTFTYTSPAPANRPIRSLA